MAPVVKIRMPFFVLCGLLVTNSIAPCNGQLLGVDVDSMHQLMYEVVDQAQENAGDVTQVLPSALDSTTFETTLSSDQNGGAYPAPAKSEEVGNVGDDANPMEEMVAPVEKSMEETGTQSLMVGEVLEPTITQKQAFCLGCPIAIDMDVNPENREAVEKLGEQIVSHMDNLDSGLFIHASPHILSVSKQVENGIRYTVIFESHLSWCLKNNVGKRGDCVPKDEGRICIAELVRKVGKPDDIVFNNCTMNVSPMVNIASMPKMSNEVLVSYENIPNVVDPNQNEPTISRRPSDETAENREEKPYMESDEESLEVENVRSRRRANVGALKDMDSRENDLIDQFAKLAVKTLDEVDPDNVKRVVHRVVEAKKQIVDGVMYYLVLQVGTLTCREDEGPAGNSSNCVEDQLYPEKICRVQIHRSWADESPQNAKVVRSECVDMWAEGTHPERESQVVARVRRSSGPDSTELDAAQEQCLNMAVASFRKVLNVGDVLKVATLKDAHSRVNKETSKQEMVVTILLTDPDTLRMMGKAEKPMILSSRVVCNERKRRSPVGRPGGLSEANQSDENFQKLLKFALNEVEKSSNSLYRQQLVRVIEAHTQVVAGTLLHLKLEIAPTSCLKTEEQTAENCALKQEGSVTCSLKVWDQPWTNMRQIQDLQCEPIRVKRDTLLGAPETIDVEDAYVKELAAFAAAEMDKGTNSPYQQKVVRVTEAKKQLVAGILMHLKMELAVTSCRKGEANLDSCAVSAGEKQVCSLKVLDQQWTKTREIQDVQCGTVRLRRSLRSKRHAIASMEVDINDPYVVESAWYAVAEMDKALNSPYHRRPYEITHAVVEHDAQTTVKLHLTVAVSPCRKNPSCASPETCRKPARDSPDCAPMQGTAVSMCYVEIEHRPWLQQRELKASQCAPMTDSRSQAKNENHLIGGDDVDYSADLFREYLRRYNKTYTSDAELKKRFRVFKKNLKLIKNIQAAEQGTAVYGPTIFSDLTPEEFKQKYLGLRRDLRQENSIPMPVAAIPNVALPDKFDWRDHNVVTPVKNQGACGSCWAFAVTGNVEGQYALKTGKLVSLSEQELVDCDTLDDGCKGGLPENAYHAIEQLGGLETEDDYPYEGDDEQCHFNSTQARVVLSSSVNITANETAMAQWLVKNGPIAIGINANAMQFYMGGVSHPFKFLCSPDNLDHGVLIVGYGVHTSSIRHKVLPYWIIKNSWSTWWGEKGYYRVYRGDGTCGVNQMASSGLVA